MALEGRSAGRAVVAGRIQVDGMGRRLAPCIIHRLDLGLLEPGERIPGLFARDREQKLRASGVEVDALRRSHDLAGDPHSSQNLGDLFQAGEPALRDEDGVFKLRARGCHRSIGGDSAQAVKRASRPLKKARREAKRACSPKTKGTRSSDPRPHSSKRRSKASQIPLNSGGDCG